MFDRVKSLLGFRSLTDEQFEQRRKELLKKIPIPVFWLFGKTGSGKSSIVRYITGSTQAEIGNGFQPQTRTSFRYDFPDSSETLVRFLDTRGLGEADYDPREDIESFNNSTHVVIVVARVMDHALADVVAPLRKIREARPTRPIILALTCLHEAYPFQQHPVPDPFDQVTTSSHVSEDGQVVNSILPAANQSAQDLLPSQLATHPALQRSLREHEERFAGLVDRIIPIDLTNPEEGYTEPNYGGKRLEEALIDFLPEACRQALINLDVVRDSLRDLTEKQAMPTILTYSSLAATSAASPLPWVDIPVVMALQTRLVYLLAELYDQKMNASLLAKMVGAIGGRLAVRFAVKAPLKLIPFVGQTANAALAFAYTFSLGKACCWYFGEMKNGHVPSTEELNTVWAEQLQQAMMSWRNRKG
ncbi:GTPase family protein [Schlesneria sp. T3-172]|uniref:GTPase family protein n=1 Tax=Schlesneria sphaerica TaxID=3373610 RepID=UPI0037C5C710